MLKVKAGTLEFEVEGVTGRHPTARRSVFFKVTQNRNGFQATEVAGQGHTDEVKAALKAILAYIS